LFALAGACGDNRDGAEAVDAAAVDTAEVATDASPAPDAAPDAMPAQFDLDIVVQPHGVEVWLDEPLHWGCHPHESFPQPGACVAYGHVFPGCHEERCIERVAVERGGVELATASFGGSWWFTLHAGLPDMFAGGDVELVMEGCGGTFRVPLGRSDAPPAPVVTDLTRDETDVRGTIEGATGATGIIASGLDAELGYTAVCHERGANTLRMWMPEGGLWTAYFGVRAVAAQPAVATPWGVARIWIETPGTSATVAVLGGQPGAWRVGRIPNTSAMMTVDGTPVPIAPMLGFRDTPSGLRLSLDSLTGTFTYTAGETMDTLEVTRPDGRYSATFPHVVPANDLDLSFAGDGRLALTVGPVTLTHDTDPARTHVVTVALAWDHPVVPRPVP
jgi:hypothetical protein